MRKVLLSFFILLFTHTFTLAKTTSMQNVFARDKVSLNGTWNILPDPMANGMRSGWGKIKDPDKNGLAEVYYEGGETLEVPGDWNHQHPQWLYYEGDIWYKRDFEYVPKGDKRVFLHFAGVSQHCNVFLNGENLGSHRGAFTPFEFEVTNKIKEGTNYIIVRVDNKRSETTIPALSFDWWNYGGITRDVNLVYLPKNTIYDYTIGLKDNNKGLLDIRIALDGKDVAGKEVTLSIPEQKLNINLTTNKDGVATATHKAKLELWSCENPKLYNVEISTKEDKVIDQIGFRTIEVKGEKLLLNGKEIFLRGINIHEEIAANQRRSCTQADAEFLVQQAIDLGCNFIRLSHYPHNEYMVRHAEKMGMLMWEEIPVWQGIKFQDAKVRAYLKDMMEEMVQRDKNRCGIILWSISNETGYWSKERNEFLPKMADFTRSIDPTRLVTSALDKPKAIKDKKDGKWYMELEDPIIEALDVIGINKYMGWYGGYPCPANELNWRIATGKPVIMSEFGSECVYGNTKGNPKNQNHWTEQYMEQNYKNNVASFAKENFPNLVGTSPWILYDFRSPRRPHALFQTGWNRKGLISPEGGRKRAWFIMRDYYKSKAE